MDDDILVLVVDEFSNQEFTGFLSDSNGVGIPGSELSTLVLTVRQDYTREILNNRDEQNVLNTNDVEVDEEGNLFWHIQPEDIELLNRSLPSEPHRCLFEWTYVDVDSNTQRGNNEFLLRVIRRAAR